MRYANFAGPMEDAMEAAKVAIEKAKAAEEERKRQAGSGFPTMGNDGRGTPGGGSGGGTVAKKGFLDGQPAWFLPAIIGGAALLLLKMKKG